MRKVRFILVMIGLLSCFSGYAQEDTHLKKMTEDLISLRSAKVTSATLNKTVIDWSSSGSPKITLMDDVNRDKANEYSGRDSHKFKMNQVVTHVYNRQNTGMVSKGDFFNSREKDVFYSAIEKNIKKGCTATYTLTGHIGVQEFVFISYNPKTKYSAKVNGISAHTVSGKTGVLYIKLPKVKNTDQITFSIRNESGSNESFVILNHNPQK